MRVLNKKFNQLEETYIELVEEKDWEPIKKSSEFEFNWIVEKAFSVYKICLRNGDKILGLISFENLPKEARLHIRLIENVNSSKGRNKEYDFIAGCLIAYTCQKAFEKQYDGFVPLRPKTELADLYKSKYGFMEMEQYLFTELANSEMLIQKYLSDEGTGKNI